MITEAQIREHLANYLVGSESLDQFEDWLVEQSWNAHQDSSEAAQDLVSEIELHLSDHSGGHISESKLRKALHQYLENFTIIFEEEEVIVRRIKRTILSSAARTLSLGMPPQEASA